MFDSVEKYYLLKLIEKIKYSELDSDEINEFAFSPIGNSIIEKLKDQNYAERVEKFHKQNPNVKKFCFEFDNHVGLAIRHKLNNLSDISKDEISKWSLSEIEKFANDVLGKIKIEKEEFDKLVSFISTLSK